MFDYVWFLPIFNMFFTPVIKFHPYCYGLFPIFSDYFRFQFCSEKQQNENKYGLFSVSLELRCVLGFWENYPDRLWFFPNFLERSFNLLLDRFRFSNFLPFPVLLQKNKKKNKKLMFFSVSLELRCVLGFWENYPDRLWILPNFLERSFNLIWTVSDFQILPIPVFLQKTKN